MTVTSDAPSREPTGRRAVGRSPGPSWSVTSGSEDLPRWASIGFWVVVAGAVVVRFAATSDLWLDEALSVNIARLPWSDLRTALEHDGAPPLYYALLHVWTDLFGTSDLAVRALSGVFAVATLPLAYAAGRRIGGPTVARATVVILAVSPYAVRYATETRMYSLLALLVMAGVLAVRRAYERPTLGHLALIAFLVAALVYTQYWAFYVVGASLALATYLAARGRDRSAGRRIVLAHAAGILTFIPWIPTFVSQSQHTGTPWGAPVAPGIPIGITFLDFAGGSEHEGYLLWFPLTAFVLLGLFARVGDERSVRVETTVQPEIRGEAFVGAAALVGGIVAAWALGSAFQSRYSSIVLPFFVLIAARGVSTFLDPRVRAGLLAAVVVLGSIGIARNVLDERTQAGEVADAIEQRAEPGDLVVACPDQLGPSVSRLLPASVDVVTYPRLDDPALVDWFDYEDRLAAADPAVVAAEVRGRAGDGTVFLVSTPGYRTHVGTCEQLGAAIAGSDRAPAPLVAPDVDFFEHPGLIAYPAS